MTKPRTIAALGDGFLQSGTGAVARTAQAKMRDRVSVEDFGASPTNTAAQNDAAFAAAIASLPATGGRVNIGPGEFAINQILLPIDPKVIDLVGAGPRATILTMGTAAGPLIRRNATTFGGGRITGAWIGSFTVKANVASDKTNLAHVAILFTGFGKTTFADIVYQANGVGSVGCLFSGESNTGATYEVVFQRIELMVTAGPSRVVYCHNNGAGSLSNPNLIELRDSWIYACSGIDVIADMANSTRSRVTNTLFEDCPGATGVVMGQACIVEGNWFELIAANITTNAAASVDGSSSIVMGNYFSGAGTSFIDTIGIKPLWIGNSGGGQTVTGQGVTKIAGATPNPAAPTLARTAGGTFSAGPTLVGTVTNIGMDALGRVTYYLRYSATPTAAAYSQITITPPAGYVIESATVGATRGANGFPALVAPDVSTGIFNLAFAAADGHEIDAQVTIVKS
jgi:hypothetical protein